MIERTALALAASLTLTLAPAFSQDDTKTFSKAVVDIGMVVKDIEVSARFYTEVLGLKEVKGFSVSAEKTTAFGLADNQPATIRVFVLDDTKGEPRTSLKIMSFPDAPGAQQDQKYIHSTLGVSYLTLFVTDMDAAVARLKKANVKLLGKTPAALGGKTKITVVHDPDGNFIELIGPSK
jgi:catechol 2,3-dioxygenase-like lactoylglutathione lyase family enzyme